MNSPERYEPRRNDPADPSLVESTPDLATGAVGAFALPLRSIRCRDDNSTGRVEMRAHQAVESGGAVVVAVASSHDVQTPPAADDATGFQAALLDAVGQAVIATDPDGIIVYWNRAAEQIYGWTAAEALGQPVLDVTPSLLSAEQAGEIMRSLSAGEAWSGDFMVRRKDGTPFPALVTNTPVLGDDGTLRAIIGVSLDLTQRKQDEEAMRRLSAMVESSGDAIYSKTPTGEIVSWNRGAEQLYGYNAEEVIGRNVRLLAPEDQPDEIQAITVSAAAGNTTHGVETRRRRKDGSLVDVSLTVSPVFDSNGGVTAISSVARDISERVRMQEALTHQALHDGLTGLPNRALVADRLTHALAGNARHGHSVAVLFLDLDHFKTINDAAGHPAGDQVLIEVARRLQAAVRPADTVARFGGDEFVIVCDETDASRAKQVGARVLEALEGPIDLGHRRLYVTASIGIAVSPPTNGDELLSQADAAMYDAKARGRGRVAVFDAALARNANEQLDLSNDLRRALDTDELHVYYQPIIDLVTGDLLAVEALSRWKHPTLGWVPPDSFVRVAEQCGLVTTLDRLVLRRAASDARLLLDAGVLPKNGNVAVNISATNISGGDLEPSVRDAVQRAGIPFSALALEVTETGVMADPDHASKVLRDLQALGVSIAIDDFGTGYSPLTYLRRLPVSTIKIDRSFIRDIMTEPDDLAITVSVIDLARSVHLMTIAEGIETAEQLTTLRRLGCKAGQGFLWSPGVPVEQLIAMVRADPNGRVQPRGIEAIVPRRRAPLAVTPQHGLPRLMQLHHEGASLSTISAALNREGFRTPHGQGWHRVSVARAIADIVRPELPVKPRDPARA